MLNAQFDNIEGLVISQSPSGGFTVNDTTTLGSDLTVTGNTTLNGSYLTLGGLVTTTGQKQQILTTGGTLTAANSGAVLIPGGTAKTFTLPAPAAGLYFKMYAGTAAAHKLQVNGGKIYGVAININNEIAASAEGQKVNNVSAVAFGVALQTGDFMEVVCDGTNWFLHAVTNDPLTLTP